MSQPIEIKVPDVGDFSDIPVIEILVNVGDTIAVDDTLVTLESDKATMDIPSSAAGLVKEIKVKLGDKISAGTVIAIVEASEPAAAKPAAAAPAAAAAAPAPASAPKAAPSVAPQPAAAATPAPAAAVNSPRPAAAPLAAGAKTHASPSVRGFARQLGADLSKVSASGPHGRILKEDVSAFIKGVMSGGTAEAGAPRPGGAGSLGGGLDLLPWPKVDFAKFGAIEVTPLSRIKKISGQNLARNWAMIPAVTYHEDADITELEAFRVAMNQEQAGVKITLLAFLIKACEFGLKKYPEFNSSLATADNGEMSLVMKQYFNIGFAADTPGGLVVPVVKNVDQKSVSQIALECGELATKARAGKLSPGEMSGACFTISSVGGIGGTSFSPIINAPEVAILGVSKAQMKPVWNGSEFIPRLIAPLSLAADHRVIDGALATRFNATLAQLLGDMRRALL